MQWLHKAAENGLASACWQLARSMYGDHPYAREVGRVGEALGVASSALDIESHDVPPYVLTSVVHWLRKGGHNPIDNLELLRRTAEGG
jgi:hypothetical protein